MISSGSFRLGKPIGTKLYALDDLPTRHSEFNDIIIATRPFRRGMKWKSIFGTKTAGTFTTSHSLECNLNLCLHFSSANGVCNITRLALPKFNFYGLKGKHLEVCGTVKRNLIKLISHESSFKDISGHTEVNTGLKQTCMLVGYSIHSRH